MREVLHLDFNPTTIAWIGGLQARVANSSAPRIRERYKCWAAVGLGELALAIATRLAMIKQVEVLLQDRCSTLIREIAESGKVGSLLSDRSCYRTADEGLPFDICAAADCCLVEWRSLYEVLRKFAATFAKKILGTKIDDSHIDSVVEQAGIPIDWLDRLRKNRNLFVHQTAPWIALEVTSREPLECSIVIMKKNIADLDDAERIITDAELLEISNRLRHAVVAVRTWLEAQVEQLEETLNRNAG